MAEWTALGGANLGILGDAGHTYGFHRAAFEIPAMDYSRRHDPGLPYNMEWACAGDFGHGGKPALRARHAVVLGGLMTGRYPMIDEFIGQPWSDQPVKYWARWLGVGYLKNYTGSGHTTWSHISWRRSRANERANLWTEGATVAEYTRTDAIWAATFTGGSSCGPEEQVPAEHRGANDTHGNAIVSQLTYQTALLVNLAAQVEALLARPQLALTDDQAATFAERVGGVLAPRVEDASARGAERALEGVRVQVDLPPAGGG